MTKPKQLIFLLLLFIVVGIAAVSSNLLINGSTPIASNPDDFNVYFSNVLVNGTQDLSLVTSETSLVFTGEFSAVGDKKEITYDVTNASKNYDADIDITCTQSTEYLTISNSFDTSTNLAATSTRTGVLSITLSKSYTGTDLTQDISCTISASAVERTSQGSGSVVAPLNPYYIGREISIGMEKFNIISSDETTVTMLAKNIIDESYKQTEYESMYVFSESAGWEYSPGPKEIDLQEWDNYIYEYIVGYENYLKSEYSVDATGNLVTLKELGNLGCVFPADYAYGGVTHGEYTCVGSEHYDWIKNNQTWWTRSSTSDDAEGVWYVDSGGRLGGVGGNAIGLCIRPTITMTKTELNEYMSYIQSLREYSIGEEVNIGDEKFNVISDNGATVTMLAKYNVDESYLQNKSEYWVNFSDYSGWEYSPGPLEIDIDLWSTYTSDLVDGYVDYISMLFGYNLVSGDLITLSELGKLGCTVSKDYSSSGVESCNNSEFKNWLDNGQWMWTKSAYSGASGQIWVMNADGYILYTHGADMAGVRPVITIYKGILEGY